MTKDIEEAIPRPIGNSSSHHATVTTTTTTTTSTTGSASTSTAATLSLPLIDPQQRRRASALLLDDHSQSKAHNLLMGNSSNSNMNTVITINNESTVLSVPERGVGRNNSTRNEPAPKSNNRGLPLTMVTHTLNKPQQLSHHSPPSHHAHEPRLIHPVFRRIPMQVRFAINGLLSNGLFMYAYNYAVEIFASPSISLAAAVADNAKSAFHPATIYAILYLIFIPVSHAMVSLLVFGWPDKYLASLMSNCPIGLTALAIGSMLTVYLDQVSFEERCQEWVRLVYNQYFAATFHWSPLRALRDDDDIVDNDSGITRDKKVSEFYSSWVLLVVTSIWTFVLSVYINSSQTKSDKKEL